MIFEVDMWTKEIQRKVMGNDPYVKLAEAVLVHLNSKIDNLLPVNNRGVCQIAVMDKEGSVTVGNTVLVDDIKAALKEFKEYSSDHSKVPPIDDVYQDREFDDNIKIGKLSESERAKCALKIADSLVDMLLQRYNCNELSELQSKIFDNIDCNDHSDVNRQNLASQAELFIGLNLFDDSGLGNQAVIEAMSSSVKEISANIQQVRRQKHQRMQHPQKNIEDIEQTSPLHVVVTNKRKENSELEI